MIEESVKSMGLPWIGKRYIPGVEENIELEHVHRYMMARELVRDRDVLDIASGEGYGSALLAEIARSVIGVDISRDAVARAAHKYTKANLQFMIGSRNEIPIPNACVDVVVSFESLEHHDQHEAMIKEIKRVLRPNGLLIISTPDKYEYSVAPNYTNEFHVKELYRYEFEQLLLAYFKNAVFYGQQIIYGSVIFSDGRLNEIQSYKYQDQPLSLKNILQPLYLIAVASDEKIPDIPSSIFEAAICRSELALSLSQSLAERDARLLKELTQQLAHCEEAIHQRDVQLTELRQQLWQQEENIRQQGNQIKEKKAQIEEQEARIAAVYGSTSWRISAPVRIVKRIVLKGRGVIGTWIRILYKILPFSVEQKLRFKSLVFSFLKPILKGTASYQAWVDFEKSKDHSDLVITKDNYPTNEVSFQQSKPVLVDLVREAAIQDALLLIHRHCLNYGPITHLIVLPFLGRGGAERVALNFVHAIIENCPGNSVLLVITDRILVDENMELPKRCMLLILERVLQDSDQHKKQLLLSDLIRAIRPCVTHNINSVVGWSLICNEGYKLQSITKFYGSMFCFQTDQYGIKIGYAADFLTRSLPYLTCMISDNCRFLDDAVSEYNLSQKDSNRLHVVYNPSRVFSSSVQSDSLVRLDLLKVQPVPISRLRVLWAGRLDAQKRLDLLYDVVRFCDFADFDVFGKAVVDGDDVLPVIENLFYRGPFAQPEELLSNLRYDAFVFTTREEGMPNILLEIGSLGIPIVAPAIGGISELISEKTGYLLSANPSAAEYRDALLKIRSNPSEAALRGRKLLDLINQRHSWESFVEAVRRLPGYLDIHALNVKE